MPNPTLYDQLSLGLGEVTPLQTLSGAPMDEDVVSVSVLSNAIRLNLEKTFGVVRVKGEVSGLKVHGSGHVYFTLKDEQAILSSVCWRGMAQKLSFMPQDGMEIVAQGRLTTYGGRSQYQLVVSQVEHAGVGALLKLLEERRLRLQEEGLFDLSRKKTLPFLPNLIGVITSPTGAVIRDIIHRIQDRCPRNLLLWPVAVQGDGAAEQIANAINGFQNLSPRPDVIILARGGGSLEDLWCFNEEVVVRAVASCTIPIISAIGHETDTTLVDYAASRRAPTPSAAAEMVVPVRADLCLRIDDLRLRCRRLLTDRIKGAATHLSLLRYTLNQPHRLLDPHVQRLDDLVDRLPRGMQGLLTRIKLALSHQRHALRAPLVKMFDAERRYREAAITFQSTMGAYLQTAKTRLSQGQSRLTPQLLTWELRSKGQGFASQHRLLMSLSYKNVLRRGYAMVTTPQGTIISTQKAAAHTPKLKVEFYDGSLTVTPDPGT